MWYHYRRKQEKGLQKEGLRMKKYEIAETIPKKDGTKVYCINERKDSYKKYGINWNIIEEIFKGTYEECVQKLGELTEGK